MNTERLPVVGNGVDHTRLQTLGHRIEQFLATGMLPYWVRNGWETASGGLHERLDSDGRPIILGYRRLTTIARQLFVFSRGARDFPTAASADSAHRCYAELLRGFRDTRHGGWYFKLDLDGSPIDRTKDLYASAFVVFGLTEYASIFGVPQAAELAVETLALLHKKLFQTDGWLAPAATEDWRPLDRSLQANPHMHLLEAAVSSHSLTGADAARQLIDRIAELYEQRLIDRRTGTLREFFDNAGQPHPQDGHIREPGHHFEWYWIIHQLPDERRKMELANISETMFAWGRRHGIDSRNGGIFDQVDEKGSVLRETKRLWAMTEGVKAFAAAYRIRQDPDDLRQLATLVEFLFDAYLRPDGTWIEILNRDLSPFQTWMPPTTCYHLYLGLSEAVRLIDDLPRTPLNDDIHELERR
ncbi:MAG TPA: AGE family epimerase/isomerase [Candidatus Baltobacteraceae bacterium]|jgi:mannose-6-phosphate isomerase|nr:AGE family epimerase/isomerase [Candidatus Baltobacteraceae bacterium]